MQELINRSRMRKSDRVIASEYLINAEAQADIGALQSVSLSRSAVGYRLRTHIIPTLKSMTGE